MSQRAPSDRLYLVKLRLSDIAYAITGVESYDHDHRYVI